METNVRSKGNGHSDELNEGESRCLEQMVKEDLTTITQELHNGSSYSYSIHPSARAKEKTI